MRGGVRGGRHRDPSRAAGVISIYSFDGIIPVVHPSACVHPTAILVGDVIVAPGIISGALV